MTDPLAQFRKGNTATTAPTGGAAKDDYVAFAAKDRVARLRIRRAAGATHAPGYTSLLNVTYDGQHGTSLVLHFGFLMVLVRGANLQALTNAIESGNADYIQEFDTGRWQRPTDKSAAIIESIEVVMKEGSTEAVNSKQQTGH